MKLTAILLRPQQTMYISKRRHVAINKIVERQNPYLIPTQQTYQPYKEKGTSLKKSLRRMARRVHNLKIEQPAPYEVHLIGKSINDSVEHLSNPKHDVGVIFNIHKITKELGYRGNTSVLMYADEYYFILRWDDVLCNPMKEKELINGSIRYTASTERKLERCKYPQQNFYRMEKHNRVYYLRKASLVQSKIIEKAMQDERN